LHHNIKRWYGATHTIVVFKNHYYNMIMEKKDIIIDTIKDAEPQNLDEAKILINTLKTTLSTSNNELQKTYKELASAREQANTNFKKLLSMTQPVENTLGQNDVGEPNFDKIKL
jgi:predicted nuclease of restriction endonuclease-like RecB superfamily